MNLSGLAALTGLGDKSIMSIIVFLVFLITLIALPIIALTNSVSFFIGIALALTALALMLFRGLTFEYGFLGVLAGFAITQFELLGTATMQQTLETLGFLISHLALKGFW